MISYRRAKIISAKWSHYKVYDDNTMIQIIRYYKLIEEGRYDDIQGKLYTGVRISIK